MSKATGPKLHYLGFGFVSCATALVATGHLPVAAYVVACAAAVGLGSHKRR